MYLCILSTKHNAWHSLGAQYIHTCDEWMDGQADNGCLDRRKDRPQIGWMNEEKKGRE